MIEGNSVVEITDSARLDVLRETFGDGDGAVVAIVDVVVSVEVVVPNALADAKCGR
jgi:hypothetical protein